MSHRSGETEDPAVLSASKAGFREQMDFGALGLGPWSRARLLDRSFLGKSASSLASAQAADLPCLLRQS